MPDLVESKYAMGSRRMCCSTRIRISVIARCAATPRICERANDVDAWISIAAIAAIARSGSSSCFPFPMTSSIRYFDDAGRTSPARRLTSISASPTESRPRRAQTRSRASCHTSSSFSFFFFSSGFTRASYTLAPCASRLPSPPASS